MRYVERSPVRAGMVKRAEDYAWSSAAAHCGLRGDSLLTDAPRPDWLADWSAWLADEADEAMVRTLRQCTHTGRPAGGAKFLTRLERRLDRRLRALPVGRPPKRARRAKKA